MPLEDYKEHFEGWLKDLKKTGGYQPIVERHEYNWSNIYSDLNRLFKDEVWNQVYWNREQENGTNIMTELLKLQGTAFYTDQETYRIIFHCFETQNSLTHLNNLLQNMCTYL